MGIKRIFGLLVMTSAFICIGVSSLQAEETKKQSQGRETASDVLSKKNYQFSPPAVIGSHSEPSDKANATDSKKQDVGADYKILVGDRLNIKIFPEDQYVKGGTMQVSSEGNVTLPLVGKVKVADKTLVEAGRLLARIIDQDYLVNAEVVIELVESINRSAEKKKKAIALGQVRRPGSYEFPPEKDKITLLELISLAGGFTEIANVKKIKVIRKAGGKKVSENVNGEALMSGTSPDIEINDGDVINVAESVF